MKLFGAIVALCFVVFSIALYFRFFYQASKQDHVVFQPYSVSPIKQIVSYTPQLATVDAIFSKNHSWIATLSADHIRVLTATGDVIPARSVNYGVVRRDNSLWPYEKVVSFFKENKSDVVFINLETPLITNCTPTVEGMSFCGDARNIEGLQYIGVTVANLANNHAGNRGIVGIKKTADLLNSADILVTGTSSAVFKDVKGVRFAFLGFNDIGGKEEGISWADKDNISSQIHDVRAKADIVIVTFHWGTEYQSQPDKMQVALGHLAVAMGADLVIGNHPHWIQPIEFYKGKLITYAHGNFVFDQMWSLKTRQGVVGRYIFYDKTLIDVEYFPVEIQDYGQPHFLTGEEKTKIISDMQNQSLLLREHMR